MFNKKKQIERLLLVLILFGGLSTSAISGINYSISKYTIDAGGGVSSGGQFSLYGTIGQADASATLSGSGFSLTGGFWSGGSDLIFANSFESN